MIFFPFLLFFLLHLRDRKSDIFYAVRNTNLQQQISMHDCGKIHMEVCCVFGERKSSESLIQYNQTPTIVGKSDLFDKKILHSKHCCMLMLRIYPLIVLVKCFHTIQYSHHCFFFFLFSPRTPLQRRMTE